MLRKVRSWNSRHINQSIKNHVQHAQVPVSSKWSRWIVWFCFSMSVESDADWVHSSFDPLLSTNTPHQIFYEQIMKTQISKFRIDIFYISVTDIQFVWVFILSNNLCVTLIMMLTMIYKIAFNVPINGQGHWFQGFKRTPGLQTKLGRKPWNRVKRRIPAVHCVVVIMSCWKWTTIQKIHQNLSKKIGTNRLTTPFDLQSTKVFFITG